MDTQLQTGWRHWPKTPQRSFLLLYEPRTPPGRAWWHWEECDGAASGMLVDLENDGGDTEWLTSLWNAGRARTKSCSKSTLATCTWQLCMHNLQPDFPFAHMLCKLRTKRKNMSDHTKSNVSIVWLYFYCATVKMLTVITCMSPSRRFRSER